MTTTLFFPLLRQVKLSHIESHWLTPRIFKCCHLPLIVCADQSIMTWDVKEEENSVFFTGHFLTQSRSSMNEWPKREIEWILCAVFNGDAKLGKKWRASPIHWTGSFWLSLSLSFSVCGSFESINNNNKNNIVYCVKTDAKMMVMEITCQKN